MREKRCFIRFDVSLKVAYTVQKETMLERPGLSKDISAGGMQLCSAERLEPEDKLDLKIFIPGGLNPVHIKGLVVWSKEITPSGGYNYGAGIKFEKIEEDNKNTFLKFLCTLMHQDTDNKKTEQCS